MKAFEVANILASLLFGLLGLVLTVIGVLDIQLDNSNPPAHLAALGLAMMVIAAIRLMMSAPPERPY